MVSPRKAKKRKATTTSSSSSKNQEEDDASVKYLEKLLTKVQSVSLKRARRNPYGVLLDLRVVKDNGCGDELCTSCRMSYRWVVRYECPKCRESARYDDDDYSREGCTCSGHNYYATSNTVSEGVKEAHNIWNQIRFCQECGDVFKSGEEDVYCGREAACNSCILASAVFGTAKPKKDEFICAICKEVTAPCHRFRTKCNHIFHMSCVHKAKQFSTNCPVCRESDALDDF